MMDLLLTSERFRFFISLGSQGEVRAAYKLIREHTESEG